MWRIMLLGACLIAATPGCQTGPCQLCKSPGSSTSDDEPAPAGELGGACLADGTCGQGLACLDGTCMPEPTGQTLLIFHNNSGPMCLAALEWLGDAQDEHSTLVVEEHLTTQTEERDLMLQLEAQYSESEGVSADFGYLPIIFFKDRAFSGFDDEVEQALEQLLQPEGGDGTQSEIDGE